MNINLRDYIQPTECMLQYINYELGHLSPNVYIHVKQRSTLF